MTLTRLLDTSTYSTQVKDMHGTTTSTRKSPCSNCEKHLGRVQSDFSSCHATSPARHFDLAS
jgi:hypothetical protein